MEETLDRAIEILAGKIVQPVKPDEALKYTQAALNLAHVKGLLVAVAKDQAEAKDRRKTKGASG